MLKDIECLIKICFKKLYTSKEYQDTAADICASEGANLAIVKTLDDLIAMNNIMHIESKEQYFWIGLKKKNTQHKCKYDDCDNDLTWADGSDFIFNGDLLVEASQNAKCFVYEGNGKAFDGPCTVERNEFLCQYECCNVECCNDVSIDGCHTGKGTAIDVASCQDYCKSNKPGATHFQFRTTHNICHCKAGSCPLMKSIGFISGKITCGAGKMLCSSWY